MFFKILSFELLTLKIPFFEICELKSPQLTFTCTKSTTERPEKDVNMFKFNSENTRATS